MANTPPPCVACTFTSLLVRLDSQSREQQTEAASFALFGENMSV